MIRPMITLGEEVTTDDRSIVEFRTVKAFSTLAKKMQSYDEKMLEGFRGTAGVGGMVIIDEAIAFDIVDDGRDPKRSTGILFKAPGVPRIQKATVERMLALYTREYRS